MTEQDDTPEKTKDQVAETTLRFAILDGISETSGQDPMATVEAIYLSITSPALRWAGEHIFGSRLQAVAALHYRFGYEPDPYTGRMKCLGCKRWSDVKHKDGCPVGRYEADG